MVDGECERQIAALLGRISHELFSHSRRLVRVTGLTRPQLTTMRARLSDAEKHRIVESLRGLAELLGESPGLASKPTSHAALVSATSAVMGSLEETEP
jgi:hypothetical protein